MTEESFPIEYNMAGRADSDATSLRIWMLSASNTSSCDNVAVAKVTSHLENYGIANLRYSGEGMSCSRRNESGVKSRSGCESSPRECVWLPRWPADKIK